MENFKRVIDQIRTKSITVKGDKMKQTERNEIKAMIVEAIAQDIAETGVQVMQVERGHAVVIPHEVEGAVVTVFDSVVKQFDYDPYFEHEEYEKTQEAKRERARKRAEKRKEDEARRAKETEDKE
ncbi:MAG: hypothetical protein ACOCP4_04235 [Candidatus Woesearchaeota archaeon]